MDNDDVCVHHVCTPTPTTDPQCTGIPSRRDSKEEPPCPLSYHPTYVEHVVRALRPRAYSAAAAGGGDASPSLTPPAAAASASSSSSLPDADVVSVHPHARAATNPDGTLSLLPPARKCCAPPSEDEEPGSRRKVVQCTPRAAYCEVPCARPRSRRCGEERRERYKEAVSIGGDGCCRRRVVPSSSGSSPSSSRRCRCRVVGS